MTKIIRKKAIFALAAAAVMAAATGTSLMVANKIKADAAIEDIHSATVGTLGELENNYQNLVMPVDRITERVASSTQGNNPTGTYGIEKMFDNNLGTKWEAVWDNTLPEKTFTFTFAQEETITGFYEVTRRDNNINGTMSWYKVYTSETGEDESWTEVISDGTMPYQLGTWSTVFSEPITAKYLRISTDADAITEFRFYYEPTSASDLAVLKTEIDKMYPFVTSGEAFNVYDEDTYQQIVTDMTAAEAMPETSAEEITAKAQAYFDVLIAIKRGIAVQIASESNYGEAYALYQEASTYYNAAQVGTQPLYWKEEDKAAFGEIIDAASSVFSSEFVQKGIYYDTVQQLEEGYTDFQNAVIKPEITQDGFTVKTNQTAPTENLMDGRTEFRWQISNGDATNFNGTRWVTFDYGTEINIEGITLGTWFSKTQGIKTFQLEYWDEDTEAWKTMLLPDGTEPADGIFAVEDWSSTANSTEYRSVEMQQQSASKFRFSPRSIMPGGNNCTIDEFAFDIVVDPDDVQITVTPNTDVQIYEGGSVQLNAQVQPHYLTNKNVTWTSSDDSIAAVSADGLVTGVSTDGAASKTVTITATTEYGEKKAEVTVTVLMRAVTDDEKTEVRTLYEIEKKYADAQQESDYEISAYREYTEGLAQIEQDIETAGSLGQLADIEERLVTLREDLELHSKRTVQNVRELIGRVTGDSADGDRFDVELIPADETTGCDVWELDWNASAKRPVLRGNDAVSLATAFNYYLKYYCYQDFPYTVTATYDVNLPDELPQVTGKVRNTFKYEYRHYFNVNCEYKYSAVNYTATEWQRRIDWMAMNGYNMFLFDFDYRGVWYAMAQDGVLGEAFVESSPHYNAAAMKELRAAIVDKAPMLGDYAVSEATIEQTVQLGKDVVQMAYDLGIEPEIRPFYGALPFMFPNNHNEYYKQSLAEFVIDLDNSVFDGITAYLAAKWAGSPQGVAISPYTVNSAAKDESEWTAEDKKAEQLFSTLSDKYYEYYMKVYGFDEYGRTLKYVYKDLVEEQGFVIKHAAYPNKTLSYLEEQFQKLNPTGRWIVSSWTIQQWELDYFSPEHTLVIDLAGNKYGSTSEFWGTQWLWCTLNNYGGNQGLGHDLAGKARVYANLQTSQVRLSGFALGPEGSDTDPLFYDFMSEFTWRSNLPTTDSEADAYLADWMKEYAKRRYGLAAYQEAPELFDEFIELLRTTYYSATPSGAPDNSVINGMPKLSGTQARPNANTQQQAWSYKNASELFGLCAALVNAVSRENMTKGFLYDMTDVTRQVLSELAQPIYNKINPAYSQDIELAKRYTQQIIDIIYDMNELLASNENFLFGTRIQGARSRGATESDKAYFEVIERTFVTYWMADASTPNWSVYDYANKQLAGYLLDWCGYRWELFYDQLDAASKAAVKPSASEFNSSYQSRVSSQSQAYSETWTYESYNVWYNAQSDKTGLAAPYYPDADATYTEYATTPVGDTVEIITRLYQKYAPILTDAYQKTNSTDKAALQAIYDTAAAMEKGEDTSDVLWDEFLTAREYAKSVLDNANAEIGEVRVAELLLREAIENVAGGMGDILDLQAKYASYSALDTSIYTDDTIAALNAALAQAKTVLDSADPEADAVTAAIEALDSAYAALKVDTAKGLAKLGSEAERLSAISAEGYTYASYKALSDAIRNAEEMIASGTATAEQIQSALRALANAESGLERAPVIMVDKTDLQTIYDMCGILTEKFYTAESWNALQTAYSEAKALLDNADATQAQVTNAYNALLDAYNGLTLAEEYAALPAEGGLNGGEIAGIVIGCVAAVAIIGVAAFLVYRKKKAGVKEDK